VISLHLQEIREYVARYLAISNVGWIKMINPPEQDPFPGVKMVGRTYMDDDASNAMIAQGAVGGIQWFNEFKDFYASRPYVHAWEFINEPQPMRSPAFRQALNEATLAWNELMHQHEYKTVGMNWSVGWPDVGTAAEMGPAIEACDYLGLHEYSANAMWDGGENWYCFRYRRTVSELRDAGFTVPPILVGECGIDGGVLNPPIEREGWQRIPWDRGTPEDDYVSQIAWYFDGLKEDGLVEAAFLFTVCSWDWLSFDVTESLAMKIAEMVASGGNGGTPPLPPGNGGGIGEVIFKDRDGNEMSEADFRAIYGDSPQVADVPGVKYTLESIQDSGEPAGMDCQVYGPFQDNEKVYIRNGGIHMASQKEGYQEVLFGGCYAPPNHGPYAVYVKNDADEIVSDEVYGLSWLCETEHRHPQRLDFKIKEEEEPPIDPPPIEPPPAGYEVCGIDVSDHQGVIDWQAVKDSGRVDFAMIRASVGRKNGTVVKDKYFDYNWREAGRVGLYRAPWHYLHSIPYRQAAKFAEVVANKLARLGHYLDVEEGGLTQERVSLAFRAFDTLLEGITGSYTRANLEHLFDYSAGMRNLWIASHTGGTTPTLPDQWDDWEFWQYGQAGEGKMPGIATKVDLNVWNGTMDEFLAKYGTPDPGPEPGPCDVEDTILEAIALLQWALEECCENSQDG